MGVLRGTHQKLNSSAYLTANDRLLPRQTHGRRRAGDRMVRTSPCGNRADPSGWWEVPRPTRPWIFGPLIKNSSRHPWRGWRLVRRVTAVNWRIT